MGKTLLKYIKIWHLYYWVIFEAKLSYLKTWGMLMLKDILKNHSIVIPFLSSIHPQSLYLSFYIHIHVYFSLHMYIWFINVCKCVYIRTYKHIIYLQFGYSSSTIIGTRSASDFRFFSNFEIMYKCMRYLGIGTSANTEIHICFTYTLHTAWR